MNTTPVGSTLRIVTYTRHDSHTERLREFGLVPGAVIRLVRKAPFNGPIQIQYRNSLLALRPTEIASMQLERVS